MSQQYIALVDGDRQPHEDDRTLIRRHLTGLPGPVLDVGCGPGHWTAYLHSLGVDATGIDMVPEFITHARATHPGPEFRLGSMTELEAPAHSVAGVSCLVLNDPPTACGPRSVAASTARSDADLGRGVGVRAARCTGRVRGVHAGAAGPAL